MVKLKERKITRLEGVGALAAALGVTPEHIRQVYLGRRRSSRIEAALSAHGIKCRRPIRKA